MKPARGDVFEIRFRQGFVYVQCVYVDTRMGELVRALPGFFSARPEDLALLVAQAELFFVFFPLKGAVKKGIATPLGRFDVPANVGDPPVLRSPGRVDQGARRVMDWWLWDGTATWRVAELTPEERRLSIKAIVNDTLLAERIIGGWTPEQFG